MRVDTGKSDKLVKIQFLKQENSRDRMTKQAHAQHPEQNIGLATRNWKGNLIRKGTHILFFYINFSTELQFHRIVIDI